jgi:polyisoprenoid-binding protein YceI
MLTLLVILTQSIPNARLARAEIWFDARATVADFQGRADSADGELVGGQAPADARGWVQLRWRDIDTKNGTRNRHMLKTVEDARFPDIRFEVIGVEPDSGMAAGAGGDSARVRLSGTLALHGVTRPVTWPAVVHLARDSVTVAAEFPVDMRDYGIKPPVRFVIARMGAVVQVHVRLVFTRSTEHGTGPNGAP